MGKNMSIVLGLLGIIVSFGVFYMFSTSTENSLSSQVNKLENNQSEENVINENDIGENNSDSEGNDTADSDINANPTENRERVFFMSDIYFYIDRSEHEDAINYQEGKEAEAKEMIGYLHDTMNEVTGYGNVETLSFDGLREGMYHNNARFYHGLLELQEDLLDKSRALHDIRNVENFYQLGSSKQTEDRMALRYAHRVIHDLDIYVNGAEDSEDRKIWGVTEAFGNDREIETMYNYLRNHQE